MSIESSQADERGRSPQSDESRTGGRGDALTRCGTASATEIGKEISAHARHAGLDNHARRHQVILIVEAVLLSIVTLTPPGPGTPRRSGGGVRHPTVGRGVGRVAGEPRLPKRGDRPHPGFGELGVWFDAYLGGNVVGRRSREAVPGRLRARVPRLACDGPLLESERPEEPTVHAQYQEAGLDTARRLDAEAHALYAEGHRAAKTGHDYIRVT